MTVALEERTGNSEPAIAPAPRPPRFIVQHMGAGRCQLVDVLTDAGRSCDGVDYTDADAARAVRDRLNASAPYRIGAGVVPRCGCLAGLIGVIDKTHEIHPLQSVRVRFDRLAGATMWFFTEDLDPAGSAS